MRKDVAKKWVKALRSGKYKQGQSYLKATWDDKKGVRYCCLGVLCELYNETMKKSKKKTLKETVCKDTVVHKFGRSDSILPSAVQKWSGLSSADGEFSDGAFTNSLTDMNDFGDSFKKIASFIEKNVDNL